MTDVRIATRRSRLAVAQATLVKEALERHHQGINVVLVEIDSAGDLDRNSPVTALTEVGAFVRSIQRAVLDGDADIAVHSCKDMPVDGPADLVAFFPQRAEPWDVLCGSSLEDLPANARVGTGSPRRSSQLSGLRDDIEVVPVRGNIDTRLSKVSSGEVDAIVLAEAGLARLGLDDAVGHRFSLAEMVPAPAQGALAVEAIRGSAHAHLLEDLDDPDTRTALEAERGLLALTGLGCRAALGAFATVDAHGTTLDGFVADADGQRRATVTAADPITAAKLLKAELGLA